MSVEGRSPGGRAASPASHSYRLCKAASQCSARAVGSECARFAHFAPVDLDRFAGERRRAAHRECPHLLEVEPFGIGAGEGNEIAQVASSPRFEILEMHAAIALVRRRCASNPEIVSAPATQWRIASS